MTSSTNVGGQTRTKALRQNASRWATVLGAGIVLSMLLKYTRHSSVFSTVWRIYTRYHITASATHH